MPCRHGSAIGRLLSLVWYPEFGFGVINVISAHPFIPIDRLKGLATQARSHKEDEACRQEHLGLGPNRFAGCFHAAIKVVWSGLCPALRPV